MGLVAALCCLVTFPREGKGILKAGCFLQGGEGVFSGGCVTEKKGRY